MGWDRKRRVWKRWNFEEIKFYLFIVVLRRFDSNYLEINLKERNFGFIDIYLFFSVVIFFIRLYVFLLRSILLYLFFFVVR